MKIALKNNLYVIEDTAQAIGAKYTFSDGKTAIAGTIGDIGTTSFFPSKNLGCYGDGGAMFIRNDDLAKKCHMIANHGQSIKYHHDIIGCNSRLDTLQAAILNVKLNYLDDYSQARQKAAAIYNELLKDVSGVKTPKVSDSSSHVYHQYTLILDESINRNDLQAYLQSKEIPSMIYYPVPLHKQKAYEKELVSGESFPVTEKLSNTVLSLPIHTELTTEEQEFVVSSLIEFLNK